MCIRDSRIAVNNELDVLKKGLSDAFDCLTPNGRIVIISYHSLEDRIVKTFFKDLYTGCICPPEQAICTCNHRQQAEPVIKKFLEPSQNEQATNPRSRSARLRCLRKLWNKNEDNQFFHSIHPAHSWLEAGDFYWLWQFSFSPSGHYSIFI